MLRPLLRRRTVDGTREFYLRRLENLLLVKREGNGGVLICATADNLSGEQQEAFVHYLVAEGLAPSDGFSERPADLTEPAVRWLVDPSWPEIDPLYARHLQRLRWYLAGAIVVCIALVVAMVCC